MAFAHAGMHSANNVCKFSSRSNACISHHAQLTQPLASCVAFETWGCRRHLQCGSSSSSSSSNSTSCRSSSWSNAATTGRRSRLPPKQQPQQLDQQPEEEQEQQQQQAPFLVALGTPSSGLAKSIVLRLESCGSAAVWATGAANHFTAIQALADANKQLLDKQQQGLATTASLSANDQAVMDDQKRGLKKLTLTVNFTEHGCEVLEEVWDPAHDSHISSNRVKAVNDLVQLMQQRLAEPGSEVVLEARGEQAVTRSLKAVLSLQAVLGQQLLIQPLQGRVVDIVAEKRGEARLAGGLLLHVMPRLSSPSE